MGPSSSSDWCQVYKLPPFNVDEWTDNTLLFDEKRDRLGRNTLDVETKSTRKNILAQRWTSYVKDDFDLISSTHTKAEFSYAIAVLDRVGGWIDGDEEGSQIEARFAASLWIYTKAVILQWTKAHGNLQHQFKLTRLWKQSEWVCASFQVENKILVQLNDDIVVPCVVQ